MQRTSKKETKRLEILVSAATAFRRRGFHGTSMEDIAHALNMTKGNLYHYFRDKEEILYYCHEYVLDRQLDVLQKIEKSPYPPEAKLRRLIAAWIHTVMDETKGAALGMEIKELSQAKLRRAITRRDQLERGIRRLIQNAMDAGIFRPGDPKLLSFAILGALNWIPQWFDPNGPADSVEVSDVFVDCFFNGLLQAKKTSSSSKKKES